ncbi:TPA: hypothetical protein MCN10_005732 [Klebsiella pneumoniae]|nr:hypothetical protein CNQ50_26155 [Escherichia coli]HBT9403341.1 hypothetical protein [Klebsiella pneumoniae]HCS1748531.1 hypothetical protein [Shigella flexneri]HBT9403765.1 hypothetical protein [Klebsiella pneumoniae]HBU2505257.1 hypothetical protein [Klebsiella pneumoniae]
MLMKAIKSVFNFYMLYLQPFIGVVLAGYGVWKFSGDSISALLEPASGNDSNLLIVFYVQIRGLTLSGTKTHVKGFWS